MIQIERITLREIRLALKEPFRISSGVVSERRICLLELQDESGAVGWSECVAGEHPNYSPETIDTAWHAIVHWLAPRVLKRRFDDPADVYTALQEDVRGHQMAKAAIEMGCWEVESRLQHVSLAHLIGGTQSSVAVGVSLGIQATPEALVVRAQSAARQGYRKIKLKISPGSDIEFVRAVREVL